MPVVASYLYRNGQRVREVAIDEKVDFVLMGGDLVRDAMSQSESNARAYFDLYAVKQRRDETGTVVETFTTSS